MSDAAAVIVVAADYGRTTRKYGQRGMRYVHMEAGHAAQNILVMTGGGPGNRTRTLGLDVWYNAFAYMNFGHSTAVGWVMGAIIIWFSLIQLKILQKVEFRTAGER